MEGGINAWRGRVARGVPEAGMAYFAPAAKAEELIALAWLLEEGSRKFYSAMAEMEKMPEAANLFKDLATDEGNHKACLFTLYQRKTGKESDSNFSHSLTGAVPGMDYLEGGGGLKEALDWAKGKNLEEILDFSIALEVNAVDLYIKMERKMDEKNGKGLFQTLSNQERNHLERLSAALEKR
jgi:rubrerythrin